MNSVSSVWAISCIPWYEAYGHLATHGHEAAAHLHPKISPGWRFESSWKQEVRLPVSGDRSEIHRHPRRSSRVKESANEWRDDSAAMQIWTGPNGNRDRSRIFGFQKHRAKTSKSSSVGWMIALWSKYANSCGRQRTESPSWKILFATTPMHECKRDGTAWSLMASATKESKKPWCRTQHNFEGQKPTWLRTCVHYTTRVGNPIIRDHIIRTSVYYVY